MTGIAIDIDHGEMAQDDATRLSRLAHQSVMTAAECADLTYAEGAELSILLSDDDRLQELNREWRAIDKPTNVLSFPGQDVKVGEMAGRMLGDIAVSMETLAREAGLENKTTDDHFCHLIVHGFLHLFGYDHVTDEDAEVMETLERAILAKLGIADPYKLDHTPDA